MKTTTAFFFLLSIFITCLAQTPPSDRQQFVRVEAAVIALTHVRVIDGTGAAPLEDQTIVIARRAAHGFFMPDSMISPVPSSLSVSSSRE